MIIPSGLKNEVLAKGRELYSWGYTYNKVCKFMQLAYNFDLQEARKYATYSRVVA